MRDYVSDIAFTSKVKEIQKQHGSRDNYAKMEQGRGWQNTITSYLADFIAERDSLVSFKVETIAFQAISFSS